MKTTLQQNRNKRRAAQKRARRGGSVVVLTALGLVALMGFGAIAVDYGLMVNDANALQRACDAAALAGASQLRQSATDDLSRRQAIIVAQNVAWRNGQVPVLSNDVTFSADSTSLTVLSRRTRPFFFARAIGVSSGNLSRRATAGIKAGGEVSSPLVVPIGITRETYDAYKNDQLVSHDLTLIRQNKTTFSRTVTNGIAEDPFVLFDLRTSNGKSGAHMQRQLEGSEPTTSTIGDYETTLNASLNSEGKKFEDGLDTRFDQSVAFGDSDDTGLLANAIAAGTASRNNPRVMYLIITPSTSNPQNGTFNTQVQGFVPVYIESYSEDDLVTTTTSGNGKNRKTTTTTEDVLRMRVRFLSPTIGSSDSFDAAPTTVPGTNTPTPSSGIYSISLMG